MHVQKYVSLIELKSINTSPSLSTGTMSTGLLLNIIPSVIMFSVAESAY